MAVNEQRRHFFRIGFDSPARLSLADRQFAVQVVDLSLRGALLRLPHGADVEAGAAARLHVDLDQAAGSEILMQGTVAHAKGRYAGVVCRSMDLDSVTHLRRLVELNLGSADLLRRELSALLGE